MKDAYLLLIEAFLIHNQMQKNISSFLSRG